MANKEVNWEKIGVYFVIVGFMFMFWQGYRDLHKENADLRERVAILETKDFHNRNSVRI